MFKNIKTKLSLTVSMSLYVQGIYANSNDINNDIAKGIAGVILITIIVVVIKIIKSDYFSKKGWEKIRISRQIKLVENDIRDLKKTRAKEIIPQSAFEEKLTDLTSNLKDLMLSEMIIDDKKYQSLIIALSKGFIDEAEMENQIAELKSSYSSKIIISFENNETEPQLIRKVKWIETTEDKIMIAIFILVGILILIWIIFENYK